MPHGIPHSRFLAWPEDDQDKALAYRREHALACSGCGTRRDEWEHLERDEDGDPLLPYLSVRHTCPGCLALEEERAQVAQDAKGVKVGLVPREVYFANRSVFEDE